jgi:hypothetical protein
VRKAYGNGEPASDDEESQAYVEPFLDNLVVDDINNFVDDEIVCVDMHLEQERIIYAAGFYAAQAKGMCHYIQLEI